ncbi:hypothetical protein DM02DRAFT_692564 [Periconia macrospinosa]|uniref:Uncharacterized protein n=1 Tax=Periconia macrospinosa TaxID=97972 RepID=A0A2V1DAX7_9PLEO|nr:hypothetical protein DM02DRAFT_692564 [Periconia macrospinosa]
MSFLPTTITTQDTLSNGDTLLSASDIAEIDALIASIQGSYNTPNTTTTTNNNNDDDDDDDDDGLLTSGDTILSPTDLAEIDILIVEMAGEYGWGEEEWSGVEEWEEEEEWERDWEGDVVMREVF